MWRGGRLGCCLDHRNSTECLPPLAPLPQEIEDDRGDIDALFAELDVSLEQSRKV